MSAVGIIAEFNPLHNGHKLLIDEAKSHGTVVAVISGNFVQRGDVAIADKRLRAKAALLAGVDLVLEMPVCYSMSTAQNFALGGVSALKAAGCDGIIFGSECGNAELLKSTADILRKEEYSKGLAEYLKDGITFAAAREKAAGELGVDSGVLTGANNNLAIEYINAAKAIGADFEYFTVKRQGVKHDSEKTQNGFASASLLREKMLAGDYDFCKDYMPAAVQNLFTTENTADIKRIENAVLSVLRLRTLEELKALPDISEGIENKLFSAIRVATDLESLYNNVKTKRYTLARIRRLVLSAFIGADNTFFMKLPPYIRVLGFNSKGLELLKKQAPVSNIPLVTRVSEIEALGENAMRLFGAECRATDLFSLALGSPAPCGAEYTAKIVKMEC